MPIRALVGIEIHRNPEAVRAQAVRFGDGAPEIAVDGRKIAVQFGIGGPEPPRRVDALERFGGGGGKAHLDLAAEQRTDDSPFHGTLVRPVQSLEQGITADAPRLLIGREIRAFGFQRVRLAHGVLNIRIFQQFRMAFHFPVIIEETSAVLGEEPHMPRLVGFRARDESGVGFLQTFKIQFEIAGTGRDGPEQATEAEDQFAHRSFLEELLARAGRSSLISGMAPESGSTAECRKCRSLYIFLPRTLVFRHIRSGAADC